MTEKEALTLDLQIAQVKSSLKQLKMSIDGTYLPPGTCWSRDFYESTTEQIKDLEEQLCILNKLRAL